MLIATALRILLSEPLVSVDPGTARHAFRKQRRWILCLLLASGAAQAGWEPLAGFTSSEADEYINRLTIQKSSQGYKVWLLHNFRTVQKAGFGSYRSLKTLQEFDCGGNRRRSLANLFYPGAMADSSVAFTSKSIGNWVPVVPGSSAEAVLKEVCHR